MERLAPSQANGVADTRLGAPRPPEPILRLQRTRGAWQVPELEGLNAEALVEAWPPGSFLVIGPPSRQVLVLKTDGSPGNVNTYVNTYQILYLPGGVSLESSNLCMPSLPHLLAFLSASRDVLPRTLLLPPNTREPGSQHTERGLSVVNKLYLEAHHEEQGIEQMPPETPPDAAETPAPRYPTPHRVSWVEDLLSPELHPAGAGLPCLAEEKEEKEDFKEERGSEDVLTRHIRALLRARSNYVARQFRGFRARLTSDAVGPHRPGDPATELLQDMRHLLTDLQDHLAKDLDVKAVFGSKGPRFTQKEEDFDSAVEEALCWAVLVPLKPALWMRLRTLRASQLRHLQRRQVALRAGAGPERQGPASALRSRIHARLAYLHDACSPRRKVALLLAICRDIYAGLAGSENQEPLGADAFLPALTEELIWSPNIGETQLDVEFLMELLDPDELRGEAGYYLTTWFGALHHIAHYEPEGPRSPQGLSSEARASLRQWHRRRTLHRAGQAEDQDALTFEEPWAIETVPSDQ